MVLTMIIAGLFGILVPVALKKIIILKRKELEKEFNISIEYFELRNKFNLNKSNEIKNSKIFIAYYLNEIRLIDNF